jgi:hypothetical protein
MHAIMAAGSVMALSGNIPTVPRSKPMMRTARKRGARVILPVGLLMAAASTLALSCGKNAPDAQSQERWQNFQRDNKRDVKVGMSAYERRQAQLAEQKKKAVEGKTGAKPAAPPGPSGQATKTGN